MEVGKSAACLRRSPPPRRTRPRCPRSTPRSALGHGGSDDVRGLRSHGREPGFQARGRVSRRSARQPGRRSPWRQPRPGRPGRFQFPAAKNLGRRQKSKPLVRLRPRARVRAIHASAGIGLGSALEARSAKRAAATCGAGGRVCASPRKTRTHPPNFHQWFGQIKLGSPEACSDLRPVKGQPKFRHVHLHR
jgi:hypothetical protein